MRFVMTYLVSHIMQAGGKLRRFLREEEGASAIEYAIIAGLIAAAIILAVTTLGQQIAQFFSSLVDALPEVAGEGG
ncbi:MAG TPA: Flp family type IVb pilin [Hyphomicrobiales bacterium]|nr:Flp family type IVb pilin [Hyphomicrobiales bacterium]